MKIGINRNKIDLEIADKTYTIGIVPIHVNYLVAKHDENESKEFDQEKHDTQLALMRECMKDLLESNGYEYDEKWLESKLDLMGMQEFVVACLAKDIKMEAKKKAVAKVSKK